MCRGEIPYTTLSIMIGDLLIALIALFSTIAVLAFAIAINPDRFKVKK